MITEREESAGKPTNSEAQLPNGKAMNKEDIICMAVEAGARDCANPDKWDIWEIRDTDLERFAALVAAHERGECAKIAFNAKTYIEAAAAIRARGEK